ncbi:sigma-E factor negative regulatory protein [Parachitinimonas caeni]|uniref:Sigma-E factor negative regulatory protein n=1 Tax=Parachitinimonas caeni TaxID=3031301 RepID=A0ABT7DW64_9NEIS|nr:sigma-E factor negative regulatory protein [Parachitinimonas caeni]MDK2124229.1 sigma-E factor negative regulatory protein [Parachitinimonas caeni]
MQEKLSALMDNEWEDHELDAMLKTLCNEDGQRYWQEYHAISDALRTEPAMSSDFMTRFSAKLDAEPVVIAPNAIRQRSATWQPKRRWIALSAAASVMVVASAAWIVNRQSTDIQPTLAPASVVASAPAANEVSVAPYLLAHHETLGNPSWNGRLAMKAGLEVRRPAVKQQ